MFGRCQNGDSNTIKGVLVSAPTQRQPRYEPRVKTANAAWKAQWDTTLAWSTMAAVAAHALVFAFWPSWELSDLGLDPDEGLLGTAWISLYALPSSGSGGGGMAALSLAVVEEPDSLPIEVDAGAGIGGSDLALVAFSGGLRERLVGRGGPAPTIVEPGRASAPRGIGDDPTDTREEEEEEVVAIVDDPAVADLAILLETSPLDLSRLSAVRPQIVLPGTSAWILIRNPAEVDRFMNEIDYGPEFEAQGLVDVAVWIDEWGTVEWAEISRSSGRPQMDEVALALFNEVASFRPARDRGVRVSMSAIFSVPFPW